VLDWIDVQYHPPLGFGPAGLVVAAAVVASVWSYWVRWGQGDRKIYVLLALLRLVALGIIVWMLLGPSLQDQFDQHQQKMPVLMLIDTSSSMNQADFVDPNSVRPASLHDGPEATRWQAISSRWLDSDYLQRCEEEGLDIRLFGFDDGLQAMGRAEVRAIEKPSGTGTDLYGAIDSAIEQAMSQRQSRDTSDFGGSGLVVLLSDGHDSRYGVDKEKLERLRQTTWPVMTVAVGQRRNVADIAVAAWIEAELLFEHQSTWIEAAVTQTGFDHRRVIVELFQEDRLVATQEIRFDSQHSKRVRFRITPQLMPGDGVSLHGYQVVARLKSLKEGRDSPADSDESFTQNNSRWIFVKVSRERIKVVLYEASPYWDTKFLAQTLRGDPQVDLTTVLAIGPNHSVTISGQESSPSREKEIGLQAGGDPGLLAQPTQTVLNQFDVVILGRGAEYFFAADRAQLLVDYVTKRGGSLVLARGKPFDATSDSGRRAGDILSTIEPVRWGKRTIKNLSLQVTPAGRSSGLTDFKSLGQTDAIVTQLPGMIAATVIEGEKAASIVLLRQNPIEGQNNVARKGAIANHGMAAVAYQNAGHGRVFAVLGDGLWRWALLPSMLSEYDSVYHLFWTRAVRWLAAGGEFLPGESVSISQSRLAARIGESVTVTATTRLANLQKTAPRLIVTSPSGQVQNLVLSKIAAKPLCFSTTLRPSEPGVYRLSLELGEGRDAMAGPSSRIAVYDPSVEQLDVSARPDVLAAISEATGGHELAIDAPSELLQYVRKLRMARSKDSRIRYVFDQPLALLLIAGCLGFEWFIRRHHGLV